MNGGPHHQPAPSIELRVELIERMMRDLCAHLGVRCGATIAAGDSVQTVSRCTLFSGHAGEHRWRIEPASPT